MGTSPCSADAARAEMSALRPSDKGGSSMRRFGVSVFAFLLGATVLATGASSVATKRPRHLSAFGEYAVRFKPGTSPQAMAAVAASLKATVIEDMHQISALEVASTDPNLLAKLTANPLVAAAFVDGVGPSANSQLGGDPSAPVNPSSTSPNGHPPH